MAEVAATYTYSMIPGTNECQVMCNNKYECTYAEIPRYADGSVSGLVTKIGDSCFRDALRLKTVTMPDYSYGGITTIGGYAFSNTPVENIRIPNTIQTIDQDAFRGATRLKYNVYGNINFLGNETDKHLVAVSPIEENVKVIAIPSDMKLLEDPQDFEEIEKVYINKKTLFTVIERLLDDYATIVVPQKVVNDYKAAYKYKHYTILGMNNKEINFLNHAQSTKEYINNCITKFYNNL